MKDLCAECGADLREEEHADDGQTPKTSQASVPMVHCVPELKVCPELAEKIGREDERRLLKDKKLALLVDLDQTIVHTTNDNVPPDMKVASYTPWVLFRLIVLFYRTFITFNFTDLTLRGITQDSDLELESFSRR